MSGVEPIFELRNAQSGLRLTAVESVVKSLSVEESADEQSDRLTLTLDARHLNTLPQSGLPLEVRLGYRGQPLAQLGVFKVGEKQLTSPPMTLTLTALADDFVASWKQKRTREWTQTTLGEVLLEIAFNHNLSAGIDAVYQSIPIDYLAQNQQSDMHLVTRLAKEYGAYGVIKQEGLFFQHPRSSTSTSTVLTPREVTRFSFRWRDKPHYDTIVTHWSDLNSNVAHKEVFDGQDYLAEPQGVVFELPARYHAQHAARRALKGKWESLHRLKASAQLTMPGRADLISKTSIKLDGFSADLDTQQWEILRSTHTFNAQGYVTQLVLRSV